MIKFILTNTYFHLKKFSLLAIVLKTITVIAIILNKVITRTVQA